MPAHVCKPENGYAPVFCHNCGTHRRDLHACADCIASRSQLVCPSCETMATWRAAIRTDRTCCTSQRGSFHTSDCGTKAARTAAAENADRKARLDAAHRIERTRARKALA